MALPNKPKGELAAVVDPEIVEHECDVLIVGGGMAACGAAFEINKWAPEGMKVILVDKASLERSGAVAQGLSAINTYLGDNDAMTTSAWSVPTLWAWFAKTLSSTAAVTLTTPCICLKIGAFPAGSRAKTATT